MYLYGTDPKRQCNPKKYNLLYSTTQSTKSNRIDQTNNEARIEWRGAEGVNYIGNKMAVIVLLTRTALAGSDKLVACS